MATQSPRHYRILWKILHSAVKVGVMAVIKSSNLERETDNSSDPAVKREGDSFLSILDPLFIGVDFYFERLSNFCV